MTSDEKYPIREIFQRFGPDYIRSHPNLPGEQRNVIWYISRCKTGELGYTQERCKKCGTVYIHNASCNNRSCPCCQGQLAKEWELERNTELVEGIAYYHVVFTMPHELNPLIMANEKLLLDLLFSSVHETILTLCADPKFMGAKPGIISVLHTWGQTLSFHPHLHLCISGGGITPDGKFVETKHKGFLIPEPVLAKMFRGKYLAALKSFYTRGKLDLSRTPELKDCDCWQRFIDELYDKRWLPFVKETFNGKGNAISYLARYSYRTAIANSRIVSVTDDEVTFSYKDYADNNAKKTMTVKGEVFIAMFLQHVLPRFFHRFRFAGYLSNSKRTKNLKLIHRLRHTTYRENIFRSMKTRELMMFLYGVDICACPLCSGLLEPVPKKKDTGPQRSIKELCVIYHIGSYNNN